MPFRFGKQRLELDLAVDSQPPQGAIGDGLAILRDEVA